MGRLLTNEYLTVGDIVDAFSRGDINRNTVIFCEIEETQFMATEYLVTDTIIQNKPLIREEALFISGEKL